MSGGRVLGGIVHAQVAFGAKWRLRVKALQAKVTELEATIAARKVHMQEETARALAQERELWQRDREAHATIAERERERASFKVRCNSYSCSASTLYSRLRAHCSSIQA